MKPVVRIGTSQGSSGLYSDRGAEQHACALAEQATTTTPYICEVPVQKRCGGMETKGAGRSPGDAESASTNRRSASVSSAKSGKHVIRGGDGGIRTLDRPLQAYNGLANRRLQPLGHVSVTGRYARRGGEPQAADIRVAVGAKTAR
jgi:hypothetical protein